MYNRTSIEGWGTCAIDVGRTIRGGDAGQTLVIYTVNNGPHGKSLP